MKDSRSLNTFPVFRVLSDEYCARLVNDGRVGRLSLTRGETVPSGSVYCLLSGSCRVYSKSVNTGSLMRELHAGDLFGVASVYTRDAELSRIQAVTDAVLYRIEKETINTIMHEDPVFTEAYLSFLSERIAFLSNKISCVTAGNAENRLAGYLLMRSGESDLLTLSCSMSDLAKLLDLGRASLYRAFDLLEERELIERDKNTIRILDRESLSEMY